MKYERPFRRLISLWRFSNLYKLWILKSRHENGRNVLDFACTQVLPTKNFPFPPENSTTNPIRPFNYYNFCSSVPVPSSVLFLFPREEHGRPGRILNFRCRRSIRSRRRMRTAAAKLSLLSPVFSNSSITRAVFRTGNRAAEQNSSILGKAEPGTFFPRGDWCWYSRPHLLNDKVKWPIWNYSCSATFRAGKFVFQIIKQI